MAILFGIIILGGIVGIILAFSFALVGAFKARARIREMKNLMEEFKSLTPEAQNNTRTETRMALKRLSRAIMPGDKKSVSEAMDLIEDFDRI